MDMTNPFTRIVADAAIALEVAVQAHVAAAENVERLRQRVEQHEQRRRAITQERLAGKTSQDTANEFVALSADLEMLRELLAEAQAAAEAARPDKEQAALAAAQAELRQYQAQAEVQAMMDRVRELERDYVTGLQHLWRTARERGQATRTIGEFFALDPAIVDICRNNDARRLERQA